MDILKSELTVDGDQVTVTMPIAKMDKENRLVSGFASLDNIDTQGDVMEKGANEEAFANWRGNVREMHGPLAVGKAVSMSPKTFFDPKTNKEYSGMYVTVYISKGAQDTWEKVLDGTLTGFSIGGPAKEVEHQLDKSSGKQVRVIKKYELRELSLVDNPANELANVVSIQKDINGGVDFKGIASEMNVKNIFYCPTNNVTTTSLSKDMTCSQCDKPMREIGWLEDTGDEKDNQNVIQKAVLAFNENNDIVNIDSNELSIKKLAKKLAKALKNNDEGGEEVSDIKKDVVTTATLAGETTNTEGVAAPEVTETVVEENPKEPATEPTENAEVEEKDLTKMLETLQGNITSALEKSNETVAAKFAEATSELSKSVTDTNDKFTALEKTVTELAAEVGTIKESMGDMTKRVGDVEGETAIKKSKDTGESKDEEQLQKSKWGGAFLGQAALI